MPRRPGDSARDTRGRIPNKVIWNLEDLIALFAEDVPGELAAMLEWIENERHEANLKYDTRRKVALGRLSHTIAKLQLHLMRAERKIRDARQGEYREYIPDQEDE